MANYKKRRKYKRRRTRTGREQMKAMLVIIFVLLAVGITFLVLALTTSLKSGSQGVGTPTTAATTTAVTTVSSTTVQTTVAGNHYVQPANAVWYLKLANDWNTLPQSYDNTLTLVELVPGNSKTQFDSRAVEALREMLAAGNAANPSLNLQPVSCYRSVARQKTLYWQEVDKWLGQGYSQSAAETKAATVVKRPGQSEHSTGLAADLGGSGNYSLNQDFENTAAFKWLYENCAEYGFILRFPKGKEDVTGVIYEPWHYRYVGKDVAKQIMSGGICLEEYLEKTAQ